jgi:hypothetical protein
MATFKEFLTESKKVVVKDPAIEEMRGEIDKIAHLLFKKEGGYVRDTKRGPEYKYYGVSNQKSVLRSAKGKLMMITFDNSTDSGEFEINSLAPLDIEKGGDTDKKIRALYRTYDIRSKKRTNYILKDAGTVMREIHLGRHINKNTVKFVKEVIKLLKIAEE